MTSEAKWRGEWKALREERAQSRRQWCSAAQELAQRAKDPLGIAGFVRTHPVASATIGAAAGALIAKMFLSRGEKNAESAAQEPPTPWMTVLRTAAIQVALPWVFRMVKEKFGWNLDPSASTETDSSRPVENGTPERRGSAGEPVATAGRPAPEGMRPTATPPAARVP